MRNNLILIIILNLSFICKSFAIESFSIFESKFIEYQENNNKIIGKGGVKIETFDNVIILSDDAVLDRINNTLVLTGNVKVLDSINNIFLESKRIEYDKKLNLFYSKDKTLIDLQNSYKIESSNISFSKNKKIIKSEKPTKLIDLYGNIIYLNNFNYSINEKKLKAKSINFKDKNNNKFKTADSIIATEKKNLIIAAKDIELYLDQNNNFGENARIKGNSVIKNEKLTKVKKGIFTSCEPRNGCPPWSIEAEEIIHNKEKKIINYKNAWLRIYNKPILYFPRFFHPDPTVERQSGFLIPSIVSSSKSGDSIKIPYFFAIANNKDFTITPRVYSNSNNFLIEKEYRQVGEKFKHISDLSLKNDKKSSKFHLFSNTLLDLKINDLTYSSLELNFENTTNDAYLSNENLKNSDSKQEVLNSFLKLSAGNDTLDLMIEASTYKDLNKIQDSDKYQYIIPNFKISKLIKNDFIKKGDLIFSSFGSSQISNTNVKKNYFINEINYNSNDYIYRNGIISNFDILYKNSIKNGKNSNEISSDLKDRNYVSVNYNINYPLKKSSKLYESDLTPKLNLRYSPGKNENNSNLNRNININNIFSKDRLGLYDALEVGQSMTLGFDYKLSNKENNNTILETSFGQIFRDINDQKLPKRTTMQTKRSNIVGGINLIPTNNFNFKYEFSADNDLKSVDYNLINGNFIINNFITSFEFLEENNLIGDNSFFSRKIDYTIDDNNSFGFNTRRNRKTDLTEFYNLIYQYKIDCLTASVEYNKTFYNEANITPKEELFFSITLTPLTTISSTNLK